VAVCFLKNKCAFFLDSIISQKIELCSEKKMEVFHPPSEACQGKTF